jgi:hypothetical protein
LIFLLNAKTNEGTGLRSNLSIRGRRTSEPRTCHEDRASLKVLRPTFCGAKDCTVPEPHISVWIKISFCNTNVQHETTAAKMMSPKLHRNVTTFTRISAGLISGASLAFFIVILVKVLDGRFPATGEGYSALPVAAVRHLLPSQLPRPSCKEFKLTSENSSQWQQYGT